MSFKGDIDFALGRVGFHRNCFIAIGMAELVFGMAELASIAIASSGVVWHCDSMNS